jgi:hypothetical protein
MDREWVERHEARHIAEKILYRVETDADFAAQAKADPVTTLTEAGISDQIAKEMLEHRDTPRPGVPCNDTTCWVSVCPASCIVTIEDEHYGLRPGTDRI